MTIGELKEILEQYDDDTLVVVDRLDYGYSELEDTDIVRFARYPEVVEALRLVARL